MFGSKVRAVCGLPRRVQTSQGRPHTYDLLVDEAGTRASSGFYRGGLLPNARHRFVGQTAAIINLRRFPQGDQRMSKGLGAQLPMRTC